MNNSYVKERFPRHASIIIFETSSVSDMHNQNWFEKQL